MSPNFRIKSEHCFYSWAKITFKEFFFSLNSIINYLSYTTKYKRKHFHVCECATGKKFLQLVKSLV